MSVIQDVISYVIPSQKCLRSTGTILNGCWETDVWNKTWRELYEHQGHLWVLKHPKVPPFSLFSVHTPRKWRRVSSVMQTTTTSSPVRDLLNPLILHVSTKMWGVSYAGSTSVIVFCVVHIMFSPIYIHSSVGIEISSHDSHDWIEVTPGTRSWGTGISYRTVRIFWRTRPPPQWRLRSVAVNILCFLS